MFNVATPHSPTAQIYSFKMEMQSRVKGKTIKQVRKLNLSGQGLTEIPADVFLYTNLTKLVLSRNAIKKIPKEIASLKKLEVLDLTYNEISFLPAPLFKLPKLRVLAVGHNRIKKFPTQMVGSSIEELIVDHNQIENIEPDALDGLTKLIISHNPISGQIITRTLPKLKYYDFRKTSLDTPSQALLPAKRKGWISSRQPLITPEKIIKNVVAESGMKKSSEVIYPSRSFEKETSKTSHLSVQQLIQKIILGEISLSQGLAFCKVLYKGLLTENSYQWICSELDHYDDSHLMPDYRIIDCEIIVKTRGLWGTQTEVLDTSPILRLINGKDKPYASPNKMLVRQGIESIEKTISAEGSSIVMQLVQGQIDILMKYYTCAPGYRMESMYQKTHVEYLNNIISSVRNKLVNILQSEVLPSHSDSLMNDALSDRKTVFISYGWDDDNHKEWVKRLAQLLSEYFNVRIDEKLPLGGDLITFMEQMVSTSDRVLLILTPKYKEKADARKNGVGYESVLISSELYNNQGSTKFIPIVRIGDFRESYPSYLGSRKGLDMTKDDLFDERLKELIDDIMNH